MSAEPPLIELSSELNTTQDQDSSHGSENVTVVEKHTLGFTGDTIRLGDVEMQKIDLVLLFAAGIFFLEVTHRV